MVVRGEVLHQNEAGDARRVLVRGWLRQLPLVPHDRDFQRPAGQLDDDGWGLLVRGGGVRAEAAVDDGAGGRDLRDLTFSFGGSQQREKEAGVNSVPQPGKIVDCLPQCGGDVEQTDGEGPQLLLLAVGELLLRFHVSLEGRETVLVTIDGEGEGSQLHLDAAQGGVELVYLDGHRGKLVKLLKLVQNLVQLGIRFRGHCAGI